MNHETQAPETRQTPVLLLTFNRPDVTEQVLEAIRDARPERLFIASDGPRRDVPTDAERVAATRAVIERLVDWPCRVERRYSDVNQGCRIGVSTAISWFFEHVEQGIILEDDCVPHRDFFGYCTELLERYSDDARVMAISGENSIGAVPADPTASYCFVRESAIWGWATWRDAWEKYDADLEKWEMIRGSQRALKSLWRDPVERRWWTRVLDQLHDQATPDTWDYQWMFTTMVNGGLCVLPRVNLVTNVGFRPDATHTFPAASGRRDRRDRVPLSGILSLTHPISVERDRAAERRLFDLAHGGRNLRGLRGCAVRFLRATVPRSVQRRLLPVYHHFANASRTR